MDEAFFTRWSWHAGISFGKQLALGDLISGHPWRVDLGAGWIRFGNDYQFPIQIIGTESEISHTWLWAWANEQLIGQLEALDAIQLLDCVNHLRDYGADGAVAALITPELALDEIDGHMLAMLATGVCRADAYYRGPYEGGSAYFLLTNTALQDVQADLARVATVINQVISLYPVEHSIMIGAYLEYQGFVVQDLGFKWVATRDEDDAIMTVLFDEQGRMASLKFSG